MWWEYTGENEGNQSFNHHIEEAGGYRRIIVNGRIQMETKDCISFFSHLKIIKSQVVLVLTCREWIYFGLVRFVL